MGNSQTRLRSHTLAVHLKIKSMSCCQCDFKTNAKVKLENHVRSKHDSVRYKCRECDFDTTSESALKLHKSIKHNEQRTIKCHLCEFIATRNGMLKRHYSSKHIELKDKRQFKCDQCDFNTLVQQRLQKHKRMMHPYISVTEKVSKLCIQTNDFVYKCKSCEMTFSKEYKCSIHIKTKHLGIKLKLAEGNKKVICQLCSLELTQSSLSRHIKRNCGSKPNSNK